MLLWAYHSFTLWFYFSCLQDLMKLNTFPFVCYQFEYYILLIACSGHFPIILLLWQIILSEKDVGFRFFKKYMLATSLPV